MIRESTFEPAWWLRGPHRQTIWPVFFRRRPRLPTRHERLELEDGDFLDIVWIGSNNGPLVLLLHGLEGSIESHYSAGMLKVLNDMGLRPVFMHFRGCSGEPNRLPRSYHSGETGDLDVVLGHLEKSTGESVSAAIGYSLGGNVLLKWLGEQAAASRLRTAVAVSVPFNLNDCALRLDHGGSRVYRNYLLDRLRTSFKQRFSRIPLPLDVDVDRLRSFRAFDDQVTAPLNGFRDVHHYYSESSSRQYLRHIVTPTLILHARDDPFMWPGTPPRASELAPAVDLELSDAGGHVGFIYGNCPGRPRYWLEERIAAHLQKTLGTQALPPTGA